MEVLIVVVSYNGETTIANTLNAALALDADAPILLIDNASQDRTRDVTRAMGSPRIRVLENEENLGVGAAFNIGIREAKAMEAKWLMLLDQDSEPKADALRVMQDALKAIQGSGLVQGTEAEETPTADRCRGRTAGRGGVGALFPTVRCKQYPEVVHYPMDWTGAGFEAVVPAQGLGAPTWITVDTAISSGALYRVAALEAVGGFNEGYFIDFVDHECHLRLREAGYRLWWVREAELRHDLGRIQQMTDSGLWIEHPPYRYYYMARNMVRGYWRFGGMRALWHLVGDMREHAGRLLANSRNATEAISWMRLGVLHGVLGKTGKLSSRFRL